MGQLAFINTANANHVNPNSTIGSRIAQIISTVVTSDSNAGDDSGGDLQFWTKPEAGVPAERMRIASGGNVGIGITAPSELLHVDGGGYFEGDVVRDGGWHRGLEITTQNASYASLYFGNQQTSKYSGIIWTSTTSGNTVSARGAQVYAQPTSAANTDLRFDTNNAVGTSSPTLKMIIRGDGKVGIGTTAPAYQLDVRGSGATTLQVKSANNSDDTQLKLQSNAFFFNITNQGAGGNITYVSDDAQDQIWYTDNASNASAERFRIEGGADVDAVYFSNSNVGIGTSAPAAELHVKGPSGDTTVIVDGPTTGDAASISFKSNGTQTAFVAGGTSGSKRLYMGCDSGKAMWLDATGLGIGTTSPGNELDVIGTTTVRYSSTTFSTKRMDIQAANTSNLIQSVTNPLHIYDNSAIRICMLQGGNVGIGTSAPSHTLEVNGSFAATTKSFLIDHPTKENMRLRYGALEGPENGVYIRGKSTYKIIDLPDYWTHLVDEESITVQLTPIGHHQNLYIEKIRNNQVFINTDRLKEKLNYYYIVHAERKDVSKLEVEIEKIENE